MRIYHYLILFLGVFFLAECRGRSSSNTTLNYFSGKNGEVKLVILDPGHFHADLLQKNPLKEVNDTVYVYAPKGGELNQHVSRITSYNQRAEKPTNWKEIIYSGEDFLQKMVSKKKGNVAVIAGNNQKKTKYIFHSVNAGFNVLADKPLAINKENFALLEKAYDNAHKKNVLIYDMMTERYDIINIVEKALINDSRLFGNVLKGTQNDPAIFMESTHHFYKEVSGKPLIRPAWYYDVEQQGEGLADVTTHLIDLSLWKCFPGQAIDYKKDVQVLAATHQPTKLSLADFSRSTNSDTFPHYLKKNIQHDTLYVFANGTMNYQVKGINVGLKVVWNFEAPEGGGDLFTSWIKGEKATLKTVQGKEKNYVKQLYIQKAAAGNEKTFTANLSEAIRKIQKKYPFVSAKPVGGGFFLIEIPLHLREGHETHFSHVARQFFQYLVQGKMPAWEEANTLAKYYITTTALELAEK